MNEIAVITEKEIIDGSENKSTSVLAQEFLTSLYNSENTRLTYGRILNRYFYELGLVRLSDWLGIPRNEIKSRSASYIQNFESANSKRVAIACLRAFYNFLIDAYNYPKNPIPAKINLPARQSHSLTKSVDKEALKKIMARLKDYSRLGYLDQLTYLLVRTLSTTSLRISEILQITREQVDSGVIRVTLKRGKIHEIRLPEATRIALLDFCRVYNIVGGPVFRTKKGDPVTRNYAHKLIKTATGLTCHSYRKSFIEIAKTSGLSNKEIIAITGQSENMPNYYDTRSLTATFHLDLDREF